PARQPVGPELFARLGVAAAHFPSVGEQIDLALIHNGAGDVGRNGPPALPPELVLTGDVSLAPQLDRGQVGSAAEGNVGHAIDHGGRGNGAPHSLIAYVETATLP